MILSLLAFTALFLAFSNGANDNFKGFATVWGSASLNYRRALALATIATVLGGVVSVAIAGELVAQFSGKGLVGDELANTPDFALSVAGGAALTVIFATRFGLPISTTHALTGGLVGAGLAQSANGVDLGNLGAGFVLPLLTSPFLSAIFAFLLFAIVRVAQRRRKLATPDGVALEKNGEVPISRTLDGMHLLSASSICFARGVNDTPKIAALLIGAELLSPDISALAVAIAMAIGGWLLSRRVAETMSLKMNQLDPAQGVSANLITAGLVLGASRFGLPVSTTHVSVGSIIGAGAAAGTLDLSVVRNVILSWFATLPISMALAFAIGSLT